MSNPVRASRDDQFSEWFAIATGGLKPYRWQAEVALNGLPDVLPVPTGLGKTEVVGTSPPVVLAPSAWSILEDRIGALIKELAERVKDPSDVKE
jgi:hypothetical protein